MKILIDTHVFLWAIGDPRRLSDERLSALETRANRIFVSAITFSELMIKASIGKMNIDFDPVQAALDSGFELLDFSSQEALLLKHLPFHHRDPFDRMLVVQSMFHKMPIMTDDSQIKLYDCRVT